MDDLLIGFAVFLLVLLLAGMLRVLLGPTEADRMMAAQLFGTSAVAILILMGVAVDESWFLDIALVFALLAVLATLAFTRYSVYTESKNVDS